MCCVPPPLLQVRGTRGPCGRPGSLLTDGHSHLLGEQPFRCSLLSLVCTLLAVNRLLSLFVQLYLFLGRMADCPAASAELSVEGVNVLPQPSRLSRSLPELCHLSLGCGRKEDNTKFRRVEENKPGKASVPVSPWMATVFLFSDSEHELAGGKANHPLAQWLP